MTTKPLLYDVYSSIIDSLNPNDLKTVVSRMKTTSKSFKNTILGDDNMNRMLSGNYFKYNDKFLITDSIILKKNKANKVTFNGMTIEEIIDIILNEGYLLYFYNEKRRDIYIANIQFKNGIFLFDCTNLTNRKYNTGEWYALCTCTLEFKNLKPVFKIISTAPNIGKTETLQDIMRDERRSTNARHEAVYFQDIPSDFFQYIEKEEEMSSMPKLEYVFEKLEKDEGVIITVIFKEK